MRELVRAFERASGGGAVVPCVDGPRRPGDVPIALANIARARRDLGWAPRRDPFAAECVLLSS